LIKVYFTDLPSGARTDWSNLLVLKSFSTLRRKIESSNPGESGLIGFDKLSLQLIYKTGNVVYNAFSGSLTSKQKYLVEIELKRTNGSYTKVFEGICDFSTVKRPLKSGYITIDVLDKLSALTLLYTQTARVEAHLENDAITPDYLLYANGPGEVDGFQIAYTPSSVPIQFDNAALGFKAGSILSLKDFSATDNRTCLITSAFWNYTVYVNWSSTPLSSPVWVLECECTPFNFYEHDYRIFYYKNDWYGEDVNIYSGNSIIGYDAIKIIKLLIRQQWASITFINNSNYSIYSLPTSYWTKMIDSSPFGGTAFESLKWITKAIDVYIFCNKAGQIVFQSINNLNSSGTVRTINENDILEGSDDDFWDKLNDGVEVKLKTGLLIGGVNIEGYAKIGKGGRDPKNALKIEQLTNDVNVISKETADAAAMTIANSKMNFYGKRHKLKSRKMTLKDSYIDFELLDRCVLDGEYYFIENFNIDFSGKRSIDIDFVQCLGEDYDYRQVSLIRSASNYIGGSGASSSSSGGSGSLVSLIGFPPLAVETGLIKLNYTDNFALTETENKLDTIQNIKKTSVTTEFARIGIGGAPDTVFKSKVTGNSWVTGNIKVDGDIYIGGNIDRINVVDYDVVDHAIRLNKNGDDITALDGGVIMLGASNNSLASIKYKGGRWTSDIDFDIASGKSYKINNVDVLNATTLGSTVLGSSLTSIGTLSHDLNIANTKVFKINSASVLSADTLGSSVINSSLQKLGTLTQNLNLSGGNSFQINGANVLTMSSLGTGITGSVLTSVGTLATGVWNATAINAGYINFNATNLKNSSNALNTIQDISSSSAPSFLQVSLTNQASTTSHSVRADRNIATSYPLAGGGDLTSDRTISLGYNNTNLKLTSNLLNTIQDIAITSVPEFGGLDLTGSIGSKVYSQQLTGWKIMNDGAADFRYLYANEMHVKSFIADLEQALAGGQIISKSVAKISSDFTVPSPGSSTVLIVEEFSGFTGAVFQNGDYVRVRNISRAAGGLTVSDCWGTVTFNSRNDATKTQTFIFTRSAAPNAGSATSGTTIAKGALALDYGTAGNGVYEVSAIDGSYGSNSPYARVVQHSGHPASTQNVLGQFGNLNGTYGYSTPVFGLAVGDYSKTNLTIDATNGFRVRYGATNIITLDTLGNASFLGAITSSSGTVGSWTIQDGYLQSAHNNSAKTIITTLRSSVASYQSGLNVTVQVSGANKIITQVGGYNDGGASRYGFSIWDAINSKWLVNIGYGGPSEDFVSQISGFNFDGDKFYMGTSSAGIALTKSNTSFLTSFSASGFEVYDASNPKLFIGKKNGSFLDFNITSADTLTLNGKFLTSSIFELTTTASPNNYKGYVGLSSATETDTGSYPGSLTHNTIFKIASVKSSANYSYSKLKFQLIEEGVKYFEINNWNGTNNYAGVYIKNNSNNSLNKIIGQQEAAIANCTVGNLADTGNKLNSILQAMRTHGLIAT
jgi:hypothetical protein